MIFSIFRPMIIFIHLLFYDLLSLSILCPSPPSPLSHPRNLFSSIYLSIWIEFISIFFSFSFSLHSFPAFDRYVFKVSVVHLLESVTICAFISVTRHHLRISLHRVRDRKRVRERIKAKKPRMRMV